jgi:hypothetical protein
MSPSEPSSSAPSNPEPVPSVAPAPTRQPALGFGIVATLLVVLGIALFGAMAYAPWLPLFANWFTISATTNEKDKQSKELQVNGRGNIKVFIGEADRPEKENDLEKERLPGLWITVVAIAAAALLAAGIGVAFLGRMQGPVYGMGLGCIVTGVVCAVALLVWEIAWVWKIVELSREMSRELDKSPGAYTYNTKLQMGLYVLVGLAAAAALVLSLACDLRVKRFWIYSAEALGLIIGGVILLMVVKPWDAEKLYDALKAVYPPFFTKG